MVIQIGYQFINDLFFTNLKYILILCLGSGNWNTDFEVSSSGVLSLANPLTYTSGNSDGTYSLTIYGVEMIGTDSTATSYVTICLYGRDCTRTTYNRLNSSSDVITAGVLSFVGLLIALF